MSLREYAVESDFFSYDSGDNPFGFAFPCCVCKYRVLNAMELPCKLCGHNVNATQSPRAQERQQDGPDTP